MKKVILFGAALAALATFNSCSSEDDIVAQEPTPVQEEPAVVKGTPFKVSTSNEADTRATLYNANAWGTTGDATKVTMFKLYGKQGTNDPWINSAIFTRSYDANNDPAWSAWAPVRDAESSINKLEWPTEDKDTETNFYAITDNAIGDGNTAAITGVSEWMSTVGSFSYTIPTTNTAFYWDAGNYSFEDPIVEDHVDASKLTDLMVASDTKNETGVTGGTLPLEFKHALAGLSINVKFVSSDAANAQGGAQQAIIKAVMVRGLYTAGSYTFGSNPWSSMSGDDICYYKDLTSMPLNKRTLTAELETVTDPTIVQIVSPGEWLVIPQTTTPWNLTTNTSNFPGKVDNRQMAYIALHIDDQGDDVVVYFPLNWTFKAAKNKTITLEMSLGRDIWLDSDNDGLADYEFEPSQSEGA